MNLWNIKWNSGRPASQCELPEDLADDSEMYLSLRDAFVIPDTISRKRCNFIENVSIADGHELIVEVDGLPFAVLNRIDGV